MNITINKEKSVFIIPEGDGFFSTLGFDHLFNEMKELASHLGDSVVGQVLDAQKGTLAQYEQYRRAVSAYAKSGKTNTWYHFETPQKVRKILEQCRKEDVLVRLFYGDTKTGRDWLEENDMIGRIGRSTGTFHVPLLVAEGEYGGPAILDHCVVKIMDAKTGKILYQHPLYQPAEFEIRALEMPIKASHGAPYTHGVWANGKNHANFTSYTKAAAWVGFMSGESCRPFE